MSVSKEVIYGIIALVIGIGSVSALVLYQQYAGVESMLKIHYMRNGQEIGYASMLSNRLAMIGEHEGVTHIYFTITIENTGQFPLTAYITGAEPSQFDSAVSSATSAVIDIGGKYSWDSALIDVSPFVGTTTTFTIHTKGEYTYAGETNTLTKDASVDLTVEADPLGGYNVVIESSTGETGGGGATTIPQTGTTVPQSTCWTAGTTCDPTNHECCNLCQGTTTETKVPVTCADYKSVGGCSCTVDAVYRCTKTEFNCVTPPCEIRQVEEKVGVSTWSPITPVVVKVCSAAGTCTYTTTVQNGYKGYQTQSVTTYVCT